MPLDQTLVEYVARLARIRLTGAEKDLFAGQLGRILEAVASIRELDTANVEPTAYPLPLENVFRDDKPAAGLTAGEALANAPEREEDFFRLPRVVGDEE